MSDEATISLNPAKTSELDFEVTVQGLDDDDPPVVRFVVVGEANYDHSFRCTKISDESHGWNVKLPALDHCTGDSAQFRVEVIVDGYYFEPAQGEIAFIKTPDIKIGSKKKAKRPTVTTSFKVKQDDEPVAEAAGGGEVTGQPQITNSLLVPEFEPKQSGPSRPAEDENIDHEKLSDIASAVVPGQGTDDTGMAATFDPKTAAAEIVARTIGKVQRPEKPGSLFARRAGKTAIPGLEDAETQRAQQSKAAKVKEILATTK